MNINTSVLAADLFCGAGGTSSGLLEAAKELGLEVDLVAINHWDVAIATHKENHPGVQHFNSDMANVNPLDAVPSGRLRLLVASPECTHFSRARGGKPKNKQSRATIKYVLRWVNNLDIEDVLIENVPDFLNWGPLHGKCTCGVGRFFDKEHSEGCLFGTPVKERRGEYFTRFILKLRKRGYRVDWRVLNAANYGDPTTRERLFIIARKSQLITWPEPTHFNPAAKINGSAQLPLFSCALLPWRTAREIIDWSVPGESIYARQANGKKLLAPNTMRRIYAGLEKFCGLPFVIGQQSGAAPRNVDEPVPTVATAGAIALVDPYLITVGGPEGQGRNPRSIDEPLPTVLSENHRAMVQPFLISLEHSRKQQPFIVASNHGGKTTDSRRAYSLDEPMKTVTSVDAWALIQPELKPFLVAYYTDERGRTHSIDDPLPTVVTENRFALVRPFLVNMYGTSTASSVDDPLHTITASSVHQYLAQPFLVKYYGSGQPVVSVDEPLPTVTVRDRFALCEPLFFQIGEMIYMLDILYRMLLWYELAAAQGLQPGYRFHGNREEKVKQIGNMVPKNTAKALCSVLLRNAPVCTSPL